MRLSTNSDDHAAAAELADLLEAQGRWQAAVAVRRGISDSASSPEQKRQAGLDLANALVQAGQPKEAQTLLESMLAHTPDDEPVLFELGTALARQESFDAALQRFLRAVALKPDDAEAQLSTAKAQVTLLRYTDAEPHLNAVTAGMHPREVAQLKGLVFAHTGRQEEAVRAFRAAAELAPNDAEVQLQLGTSLAAIGKNEEAVPVLLRSATLRPGTSVWFQLSRAYRALGKTEEERHAVARLQSLETDRSTGNRVAVLRNAAAIAVASGKWQDAIAADREALELQPNNADVLFDMALTYGRSGQEDLERKCLLEAIAIDSGAGRPRAAKPLAELGKLEVIAGDGAAAKQHLEEALRLDPENTIALTSLAVLLARENDAAAAEALLLDATGGDPGSAEAFRDLGLVQASRGKLAEAERALNRSLALDPKQAATGRALVQVYTAERKWEPALSAYRHWLALGPDTAATSVLRRQLCAAMASSAQQTAGKSEVCGN